MIINGKESFDMTELSKNLTREEFLRKANSGAYCPTRYGMEKTDTLDCSFSPCKECFKLATKDIEFKDDIIKQGDKAKVIDGVLKDANIEGIVTYVGINVFNLKLNDGSILQIDKKYIKREKLEIHKETFTKDLTIFNEVIHCTVKIRGKRTTVILDDSGDKGSVYCNENDEYSKGEGMNRAFMKAVAKKLLRQIQE